MGNVYAYNNRLWREIYRFGYTGEVQPFTLDAGEYLLQCHGAKGGATTVNAYTNPGGSSFGILNLNAQKTLYAYVGGNGTAGAINAIGLGGFNGGGNGGAGYNSSKTGGSGGGGASDIRVKRPEDYQPASNEYTPTMPEGYVQVPYIESNGTQYFDSGYTATTNTVFTFETSFTDTSSDMAFLGSQSAADTNPGWVIWLSGHDTNGVPSIGSYFGNQGWNVSLMAATGITPGEKAVYQVDQWGTRVNQHQLIKYDYPSGSPDNTSIIILGCRRSGSVMSRLFCGKLYYFRIYETDNTFIPNLVREYIPCQRVSDGKPGLYEMKTNTFITATNYSGSTDVTTPTPAPYTFKKDDLEYDYFTYEIPTGYTPVEFIESDGHQYINSGYHLQQTDIVLADAMLLPGTSTYEHMFGLREHDISYVTNEYFVESRFNSDFNVCWSKSSNNNYIPGSIPQQGTDTSTTRRIGLYMHKKYGYFMNQYGINTLQSQFDGTVPTIAQGPLFIFEVNMPISTPFTVPQAHQANVVSSQINVNIPGRTYAKITDSPAIGMIVCIDASPIGYGLFTCPLFMSPNADAVGYTYNQSALGSFTYHGVTWYYSGTGYAMGGDSRISSSGIPTYGETGDSSTMLTWINNYDTTQLINILESYGVTNDHIEENIPGYEAFAGSGYSVGPSHMRLYKFFIYDKDGNILHAYLPCKRNSDQELGLLDVIDGTFHDNQYDKSDISPFTAGSDLITLPKIISLNREKEDESLGKSLLTRIMVAGGGGGGSLISNDFNSGYLTYTGCGGGVVGGCISCYTSSESNKKYATQQNGYMFGIGENGSARTLVNSSGVGGGGGGWFGGYAITNTESHSYLYGNGAGGSGYVLTSTSYKPTGYGMEEDMTPFYMTSPFMNSGTAIEPFVSISVPLVNLLDNDTIIIYPTGSSQSFQLSPGKYQLKCWGGDGGVQGTTIGATRGGYSEGILSLGTVEQCHVYVGGTGLYDCLISQEYVYQLKPDLSWNGGGMEFTLGDYSWGRSGGGATDIRIGSDSLYSRIIVAGGSGGANGGGFGGRGGGETGGTANGSNGYNPGPGTQTDTGVNYPQYPDVHGGFGYGGDAGINSGYRGGAGGSGWFGGGGTYPSTSGSQRSGAGGSGYVLTESSYKPEGYLLDESYYLSNAQTYDGANDLPYGITRAEIVALSVLNYRVLCRDQYGIKYWDEDLNRWALLPSQELTQSNFETYGVFTITSDTGLADTYEVLVYDPEDVVEKVLANITPNKQTITNTSITAMPISKMTPELDVDTNIFDVDIKAERKITSTNIKIITTITIDKKQRSDKIPKLYYIIYSDQ